MASRLTVLLRLKTPRLLSVRTMSGGKHGDGVGKGGGSGGSIREAGGAFGKMEVAKEEQYFRAQQKQQLEKLKELMEDEVAHHEIQIRQHMSAIEHHKKKIDRIEKKSKDGKLSD